MKKSIIVWVPMDLLYNLEIENTRNLYRISDEDFNDSHVAQDMFDEIDRDFIEEKINK